MQDIVAVITYVFPSYKNLHHRTNCLLLRQQPQIYGETGGEYNIFLSLDDVVRLFILLAFFVLNVNVKEEIIQNMKITQKVSSTKINIIAAFELQK